MGGCQLLYQWFTNKLKRSFLLAIALVLHIIRYDIRVPVWCRGSVGRVGGCGLLVGLHVEAKWREARWREEKWHHYQQSFELWSIDLAALCAAFGWHDVTSPQIALPTSQCSISSLLASTWWALSFLVGTMSSKSKSAINGRSIDISRLEREIQADVATYRQYKAEDGMKKRAIHTSKSNNS